MKRAAFACFALVGLCGSAFGQDQPGNAADWLTQADMLVKVIVGLVAFIAGLIGLPVAYMTVHRAGADGHAARGDCEHAG